MARQTIEIELVKNETSYRRALRRLAWYFDHPPKAGTADDTEFGLLMLMCDRYEAVHHPVPQPDPVSAIQFAIDQRGGGPAFPLPVGEGAGPQGLTR